MSMYEPFRAPGTPDPEWDDVVAKLTAQESTAEIEPYEAPAAPVTQAPSMPAPAMPLYSGPLHGTVHTGATLLPSADIEPKRTLWRRASEWASSRTGIQTLATCVLAPSGLWGFGEILAAQSAGWTGFGGTVLALAGGALAIGPAMKGWASAATWTAGTGIGVTGLTVAAASVDNPWIGLSGWAVSAVAASAARVSYANSRKPAEAELKLKDAQVRLVDAQVNTEAHKGRAMDATAELKRLQYLVALQAAQPQVIAHHGLSYQPTLRGDETAAECQLMFALVPGRWADMAAERGLEGTAVIHCALTDAGIEADIRLDGRWSTSKLAGMEEQIRAMASIETGTRLRIGPGPRGDVARVLIRTRSASDGMSTDWAPDRPGIGVCTETGEIVDVPVEGAHSMTGGRTNMGKSAYARIQLMRTVADPLRAGIVIDPKRAEAVAWLGKLRTAGSAADPDERDWEVYSMIRELMAEFRHRQTLFPGLYWEASVEYPTLFITLDEGAALKRMAAKEVTDEETGKKYKPYEDVLSMAETLYGEARVVGMWFNWASQYLAKGTSIPQLVKENVGAIIGLTTLGGEGDRMLFGEEAGRTGWSPSEACEGIPGRAMVKYRDRKPFPVQLWHVTGDHIAALPNVEPWRSRAGGASARSVAAPPAIASAAAGTGEASNLDKVRDYMAANPHASKRVVAEATGVPEGSVGRLMTQVREGK